MQQKQETARPIGQIVELPKYIHYDAVVIGISQLGAFTPEFAHRIAQCIGEEYAAYWCTGDNTWYALPNGDDGRSINLSDVWRKFCALWSD